MLDTPKTYKRDDSIHLDPEFFHSNQPINGVLREVIVNNNPRGTGRPNGVFFAGCFFEDVQNRLEVPLESIALKYDPNGHVVMCYFAPFVLFDRGESKNP